MKRESEVHRRASVEGAHRPRVVSRLCCHICLYSSRAVAATRAATPVQRQYNASTHSLRALVDGCRQSSGGPVFLAILVQPLRPALSRRDRRQRGAGLLLLLRLVECRRKFAPVSLLVLLKRVSRHRGRMERRLALSGDHGSTLTAKNSGEESSSPVLLPDRHFQTKVQDTTSRSLWFISQCYTSPWMAGL